MLRVRCHGGNRRAFPRGRQGTPAERRRPEAPTSSDVKLQLASTTGNVVTGAGPGWLRVGAVDYHENLLLTPGTLVGGWAAGGFAGLSASDFAPLVDLAPEVVVFGSGAKLAFPRPEVLRPLTDAGIGVEVMDTPAACRTYNILAGEGRRVAAALLVEPGAATTGRPATEAR